LHKEDDFSIQDFKKVTIYIEETRQKVAFAQREQGLFLRTGGLVILS
jgi:hypothetical protein